MLVHARPRGIPRPSLRTTLLVTRARVVVGVVVGGARRARACLSVVIGVGAGVSVAAAAAAHHAAAAAAAVACNAALGAARVEKRAEPAVLAAGNTSPAAVALRVSAAAAVVAVVVVGENVAVSGAAGAGVRGLGEAAATGVWVTAVAAVAGGTALDGARVHVVAVVAAVAAVGAVAVAFVALVRVATPLLWYDLIRYINIKILTCVSKTIKKYNQLNYTPDISMLKRQGL